MKGKKHISLRIIQEKNTVGVKDFFKSKTVEKPILTPSPNISSANIVLYYTGYNTPGRHRGDIVGDRVPGEQSMFCHIYKVTIKNNHVSGSRQMLICFLF